MELRPLRYFVAVAEEGHFGRAASRLRLAQPTLSRQIQALESEIGFPLFDRSHRQIELTPAGHVMLEHARRLFASVDVAVREAHRASLGQSGRLAVAYPSSLAYSGLPELLRSFRAKYPDVEVLLRELSPQEQVESLHEGRLDVGFIRAPIIDDATLASELVLREPLMLALPSDHRLASRTRIALDQVAHEPFVLCPRSRAPGYVDLLTRLCRDAGFTPNITQEAPLLDMLSLVAAGFGVSIVPASLRHTHRAGLVLRPIVGRPRTDLLVAWARRNTSPLVEGFLTVVRAFALRRRQQTTALVGKTRVPEAAE
ncbi:MAG: LysR family transcriptional regulator [Myxococcales bacterium]|nr:MAG: LysR family transcriptional regulator [Myxococcales bacterium]